MEPSNPLEALVAALSAPGSPFAMFFSAEVLAKLTTLPVVGQWVKSVVAFVPGFKERAGQITGVLVGLAAGGLVVWGGIEAKLAVWSIISQSLVAFIWVEFVYSASQRVMRSPNPLVPANPAILATIVALLLCMAPMAGAQTATYPVFDVAHRTQLSVNLGGMQFFEEQTGAEGWRGISAGGALTYSLHDRLSLFGLYDHGFPLNATDGHENILRAAANLKVFPAPGDKSATNLWIGGGGAFFNRGVTEDWRGYEGHVTLARIFKDGWSLSGMYLYGITGDDADPKLNMAKVAVAHRLLGAK